MTLVAVVSQSLDRYCLDSLSPFFLHLWVTVIEGVSVTFAMFCLIQFYIQLRVDLAHHRPFLKVLAIKLVIFLCFWQTIIINFLTSSSVIKESPQIAIPDVKIGIPAMLICMEMAIFAGLHLVAYPWKVYDVTKPATILPEDHPRDPKTAYLGGFMGYKAFLDVFNLWDLIKAIGRGFRWAFVGRKVRKQDKSYKHGAPFVLGAKKQEYELVGAENDNEPAEVSSPSKKTTEVGYPLQQTPHQPPQKAYAAYNPRDQPAYSSPYHAQSTPYPDEASEARHEVVDGRTHAPGTAGDERHEWSREDTSYHGAAQTGNNQGDEWTHAR